MSSDKGIDKQADKVQDGGQEKQSLKSPDAHGASNADKSAIQEIEKQNKDHWESEHGMFAIVDDKQVVASKKVQAKPDTHETVSKPDALPDDSQPVGGYVVEQTGKDKLLFKLGVSNAEQNENLTTAQIDALAGENKIAEAGKQMLDALETLPAGQKRDTLRDGIKRDLTIMVRGDAPPSGAILPSDEHAAGSFKALTPETAIPSEVQNNQDDSSSANTQNVFERIAQLPPDKQLQVIGAGLLAFSQEYNHQQIERSIGAAIGIGEGVGALANDAVELVKGVGSVLQFGQDVMTNNPRAIETAGKAGEALGRTLVSGVRLFEMSHDYLYDIGYTGDYSKPFKDISKFGQELDRRWNELPPREQARLATRMSTEVIGAIAIPAGATKIAKTGKVTAFMEELATKAGAIGGKAKDKAIDVIAEAVDGLTDRLPPMGRELAPVDGPPIGRQRLSDVIKEERRRAQAEKEARSLMSQADEIDGAGSNNLEGSKTPPDSSESTRSSLENAFEQLDKLEQGKIGDPFSEFGEKIDPERIGMTDRLSTLSSWLRIEDGRAKFKIEYIRSNFTKKNTFRDTIEQVANLAKDYGAESLEVMGQGFNERLKGRISKWYEDSFVDLGQGKGYKFTVPLREE